MLLQFLAEALFLSVTGGFGGILVGVGVSEVVSRVAGWPIVISVAAMARRVRFFRSGGRFSSLLPCPQGRGTRSDPGTSL